jgi:hypothetical protein
VEDSAIPDSDVDLYRLGVQRADRDLDEQLAAIRAAEDAGRISVREAADNRILAMEVHLTELQRLRRDYLT